ncbi:hypothetical protein WJX72_009271 [[Myrmecia] bisecta]|uniref:Uncharacterized protein n=1 Tax=[Myrmecia] bisecta TaxID=41462 RepID=A0AAW1Q697_9CHLO
MRALVVGLCLACLACTQADAARHSPAAEDSWRQWLDGRLADTTRHGRMLAEGPSLPTPQPTHPSPDVCIPVGGVTGSVLGLPPPTTAPIKIPRDYNFVQLADFLNASPQELLLRRIPTKIFDLDANGVEIQPLRNGILTKAQYNIVTQAQTFDAPFDGTNQLTTPANSHFAYLYALQDTLRWIDVDELLTHEKHDRLQICDMLAVYSLARLGIKESILPGAAKFYRRITADHCFLGAATAPVCVPGQTGPAPSGPKFAGSAGYIQITQGVAADLLNAITAFQTPGQNPNNLDQLTFQQQYLDNLCEQYEGPQGLDVNKDPQQPVGAPIGGFNRDTRILTQLQLVPDFLAELKTANTAVTAAAAKFTPGTMPPLGGYPQPLFATWPEYPDGGSQPAKQVPAGSWDTPVALPPDTTAVFTLGKPLFDNTAVPVPFTK